MSGSIPNSIGCRFCNCFGPVGIKPFPMDSQNADWDEDLFEEPKAKEAAKSNL
jgi:hypothetical protein